MQELIVVLSTEDGENFKLVAKTEGGNIAPMENPRFEPVSGNATARFRTDGAADFLSVDAIPEGDTIETSVIDVVADPIIGEGEGEVRIRVTIISTTAVATVLGLESTGKFKKVDVAV